MTSLLGPTPPTSTSLTSSPLSLLRPALAPAALASSPRPPAGSSSQRGAGFLLAAELALAKLGSCVVFHLRPGVPSRSRLSPCAYLPAFPLHRFLILPLKRGSVVLGVSKQTNKQKPSGMLWFPLLFFHLPGVRNHLSHKDVAMHGTELSQRRTRQAWHFGTAMGACHLRWP